MGNAKIQRFTRLALLCAMAIMLNMLETFILSPFFGIFRVGVANIVALVAIELLGTKDMIIVNIMRVVIGSLLSGRFLGSTFWISAGGVALSSLVLIIFHWLHSSLTFKAVLSAIAHSLGQIGIVILFYMQPSFAILFPYFLLLSIGTGILTGTIAGLVLKRVKPIKPTEA